MTYRVLLLAAASLFLVSPTLFAQNAPVPVSNVAGKKLIRVAQELIYHTPASDVPAKVRAWQETGYDGLCFSLRIDPAALEQPPADDAALNMLWRWWDVDERRREEFERDIKAFKSVKDWGRLTDNFLWMASHVEGHKPPDWFSDEDWEVVLANARLGARIAKEAGFKGIFFDSEGYGGGAQGVWRQPWDYALYARSDYVWEKEKRSAPRPFDEVAPIVRRRGRQWAEALSAEYPDLVLGMLGLYENAWGGLVSDPSFDGDLAKCPVGLWPAFIDGVLEGLDDRAMLVSFCGATYLDSQYRNLLVWRDFTKEQALVVSSVPELARRRISFAAGIWTDAGYGGGAVRFHDDDARANQRDPDRHKHAVHNTLAASDHYAWQWGEWGKSGESNFTTTDPTPLMRQYWQANVNAHQPQDLMWEPDPHHDDADYDKADAEAREKDDAFWKEMRKQGYTVAAALPEYWKFRLDLEMAVRFRNYMKPEYNDSSWFKIKCTSCWQSQGFRANEIGLYRVKFSAPADLDPEKQEIVLAFSAMGSGTGHVYLNGAWISYLVNVVDVSKLIKAAESNHVGIVFDNKSGPGGLMGHVKLLVRDRK